MAITPPLSRHGDHYKFIEARTILLELHILSSSRRKQCQNIGNIIPITLLLYSTPGGPRYCSIFHNMPNKVYQSKQCQLRKTKCQAAIPVWEKQIFSSNAITRGAEEVASNSITYTNKWSKISLLVSYINIRIFSNISTYTKYD